MANDNMHYWNKMKRPPESALKNITGGRLKGMTDISPQWRFEIMTENFGMIGRDWFYTIEDLWTVPGEEGQVFAFAKIALFIGDSKPIMGIGGSMLIETQKGKLYHNEEAYKMATTDALSVAMKQLGVGADIYAGKWDGSKYKEPEIDKAEKVKIFTEISESIKSAETQEQFDAAWMLISQNKNILTQNNINELIRIGKERKQELSNA